MTMEDDRCDSAAQPVSVEGEIRLDLSSSRGNLASGRDSANARHRGKGGSISTCTTTKPSPYLGDPPLLIASTVLVGEILNVSLICITWRHVHGKRAQLLATLPSSAPNFPPP